MSATTVQSPRPTTTGTALLAAAALHRLVPGLVALALDATQAHRNLEGPGFRPLQALTGRIAADAFGWADRVAERAMALGHRVDGRPAATATAGPFLSGRLRDREVAAELGAVVDDLTARAGAARDTLAGADAVGHVLVVSVLEGLEQHRWLLHGHARAVDDGHGRPPARCPEAGGAGAVGGEVSTERDR